MKKFNSSLSFAMYAFSSISCCQGIRVLEKQAGVDGTDTKIASTQKTAPWDLSRVDTKKWGEAEWDKWYSDLEKKLKTSDGFDLGGNQQQWPEWTAERKKAARTVGEDKLLSDYLEAKKLKNGGTK